jgi:agarase
MHHLILYMIFTIGPVGIMAQTLLDVNLDVRHVTGGIDSFDREKYIVLHANLRDNEWDSDEQRADFLNTYDVYLGRDNGLMPWQYNQSYEDPARPGYPDMAKLAERGARERQQYAGDAAARALEFRAKDLMIGGQISMSPTAGPTNPNPCCGPSGGWDYAGTDALSLFMGGLTRNFFGEGGASGQPRPTMVEVVNEPFYQVEDWNTDREGIIEWHNQLARAMDSLAPSVLVGGYTAAFPELERNDFRQWEDNWKKFIDGTGQNMDFYSVHLYDYGTPENTEELVYRSGANIEAILDMIEHYSTLQFGTPKPWNISEYGSWSPGLLGTPYSESRDWHDLRSFSTMMMQLLERPDRLIKAVPFTILKANWWSHPSGNRYPHRLMRQESELAGSTGNDWVYTNLVKWYDLWKDVKGTRIDTWSPDPDVQLDAYVHESTVYLILNNLEHNDKLVELNIPNPQGLALETVELHHLFRDDQLKPQLVRTTASAVPPTLTIGAEATLIVELTYAGTVEQPHTSTETKHYASSYLQPIGANVPTTFTVAGTSAPSEGEVVLRLGIGRDRPRSRSPRVTVNGSEVVVPDDYRGYEQGNRDRFFGVLEIPVNANLLRASNEITITFPDDGGHVSSVALQRWAFSRRVVRGARTVAVREPTLPAGSVTVQPNPAGSQFTLRFSESVGQAEVRLLDTSGRELRQWSAVSGSLHVSSDSLDAGTYILRVQAKGGSRTERILIHR